MTVFWYILLAVMVVGFIGSLIREVKTWKRWGPPWDSWDRQAIQPTPTLKGKDAEKLLNEAEKKTVITEEKQKELDAWEALYNSMKRKKL